MNDSLELVVKNFENHIKALEHVSDCEAMIGAMKMVSLFKDGHSNLIPFQLYMKTRYLPIQVFYFEDGLYITESTQKEIIGAKILSINEIEIDTITKRIMPLIGADNPYFGYYQSSLYIPNMDVLQCMNILPSTKEASLKVLINGEKKTINFKSISMINWLIWSLAPINDSRPVGHNIRNADPRVEIMNDTIIWMNFNKTGPENNLTEIGNNISNQSYGEHLHHVVIDMRNNTGGDNTTYNDLIKSLADSKIEIFILTSRKTFSAGINFISELKLVKEFIVIGEPTGAGHNHYGDAETLFFPNSGLMFTLSTKEWSFIPSEEGKSILADIPVLYYASEYFKNEDPWLKALIENHKRNGKQ
jgi:hypothetical protein